jgi:hypothetical protein
MLFQAHPAPAAVIKVAIVQEAPIPSRRNRSFHLSPIEVAGVY